MEDSSAAKKRTFKRGEEVGETSFLDKKIQAINESQMPEGQKIALLKELGVIKEESLEGKVPFVIFAKVNKISVDQHKAMLAYPKAKGVSLASIAEWNQIFKEF